ncbi:hypothetical protein STRIP9103_04941 [Streptomyces ipomoeae 91-03]|uniref:Tc1-like transposase DDE domain-containing protein n=1 Tax=Streptomyces ipomoeae 91-03 TaxID=698759 RepID=L1KT16_9ACTN|nr:hypothetical protein STRIP9103_04941 [Streptomyces ipomoeae 91-03]
MGADAAAPRVSERSVERWRRAWRNVRLHLTAGMREFTAENARRLTDFQLPSYAPDLNPQAGIWSRVKRDIGSLAAADLGQITRAVKRRLKQTPPPRPGRRLPGRHRSDLGQVTGTSPPSDVRGIRWQTGAPG